MIKVLDNTLINKIAAGEVVERPASVVKELVENSIDAGATSLIIEIKNGGIDYIRVTDNGKGIAAEQVRTAFLRHATSKISEFDDLVKVLTLGFRGEALSSIAGVAEVELYTKTTDNNFGRKIEIYGGEILTEVDEGGADGTSFIARNLFFNVPARRKFLKRPSIEAGHISDVVMKNALGNPHIAIKYINNGAVMLQTNGNSNLRDVVFATYGAEIAKNMIEVSYKKNGFEIKGLIGKNELARANRNYESFFINGRYVKSSVVHDAVMDAYQTRLPTGRFPVYVLSLVAAPEFCDVNVHPTKLEVRFADENAVYEAVNNAVKSTLDGLNMIPSVSMPAVQHTAKTVMDTTPKQQSKKQSEILVFNDPLATLQLPKTPSPLASSTTTPTHFLAPHITEISKKGPTKVAAAQPKNNVQTKQEQIEIVPNTGSAFFNDYRIIGQILGTYWVIEQGSSVFYLDQHAAHERVMFEELSQKLANGLQEGLIQPQNLLTPIAINVQPHERDAVMANLGLLENLGFEIEELGDNAIAVRAVPYIFSASAGAAFFSNIIDVLVSDVVGEKINDMVAVAMKINSIACKAAVKANDRLSFVEAKALVEQALKLDNPFTCPHGRPTIVEISAREIEKMFKRIQ